MELSLDQFFIILIIGISGAFGGFLGALVHGTTFGVTLPSSKQRLDFGFLGNVIVGVGAAIVAVSAVPAFSSLDYSAFFGEEKQQINLLVLGEILTEDAQARSTECLDKTSDSAGGPKADCYGLGEVLKIAAQHNASTFNSSIDKAHSFTTLMAIIGLSIIAGYLGVSVLDDPQNMNVFRGQVESQLDIQKREIEKQEINNNAARALSLAVDKDYSLAEPLLRSALDNGQTAVEKSRIFCLARYYCE